MVTMHKALHILLRAAGLMSIVVNVTVLQKKLFSIEET